MKLKLPQITRKSVKKALKPILFWGSIAAVITVPFLYKLGTLVSLSPNEQQVSGAPIGWTGIAEDPLYLPMLVLRSAAFFLTDTPGAFVTRLPNVLVGAAAVIAFTLVIKAWHGTRIGLLAGALFLTSAWTLHVSRYASYDVLYFAIIPALLALQVGLLQRAKNKFIAIAAVLFYSSFALIPGGIWFVLAGLFWQKKMIAAIIKIHASLQMRIALGIAAVLPFLLLGIGLGAGKTSILAWLGLPETFPGFAQIGQNLLAVPLHIFVFAPNIPELWLGRLPIYGMFTLACIIFGLIYYLGQNLKATRTRMLLSYGIVGWLLIAAGGPVVLSVLVPLGFVAAAAGMSSLLRDWLSKFPLNPFARAMGISLLTVAVLVTMAYNAQRYYIAWPNADQTKQIFKQ